MRPSARVEARHRSRWRSHSRARLPPPEQRRWG
jgi:hypothetical protein